MLYSVMTLRCTNCEVVTVFCGYTDESAIAFIFLLLLKAILVIPSSPLFSLINQRFAVQISGSVLPDG